MFCAQQVVLLAPQIRRLIVWLDPFIPCHQPKRREAEHDGREAKGQGERLKGDLTARSEFAKAAGSLLTMGYQSQKAGRLVIS